MKSILGACRRILTGLLAGLILLGGWLYWQAPPLNELRPELERLLASQLGLKELRLGNLSWRWAGYIWVNADNITFVGSGQRLKVDDAQLEVRLSSWELMRGDIRPTSIRLRNGRIVLHIPKAASDESFPFPAGLLHIEDSTVTVNYGDFTNRFEHLDLRLDADHRTLGMQLPGFMLDIAWDKQLQPQYVHTQFDNLLWLPETWRTPVQGEFSARLQLDKSTKGSNWNLLGDINSDNGVELIFGKEGARFPLSKARIKAHVVAGINPLDISAIDWQELVWQTGVNSLQAKGSWADGRLQLQAQAGELQIDKLAALGMPLTDEVMRQWLSGLAGTAKNMQAELRLLQDKPWAQPQPPDLKKGDVKFSVDLSDATIPLATQGEELRQYNGEVNLSSEGLVFRASSMQLPFEAGVVHGTAVIADFDHPVFDIKGQGRVDIGRLESWMQVKPLPQLVWKSAPADGDFLLSWPMFAVAPDTGEAHLVPQPVWKTEFMGYPVALSGGHLYWKAGSGLRFQDMNADFKGLQGNFDLEISDATAGELKLLGLRVESSGDFSALVTHFQMPMDGPSGSYAMSLLAKEEGKKSPWSFQLDLKDAGWLGLLGSKKAPGEAYSMEVSGRQTKSGISIDRIQSSGVAPFVSGAGEVSRQLAKLYINALQAPSFSGALSIRVPLAGDEPLEIDVNSDFLDQSALPKRLPDVAKSAVIPAGVEEEKRKWVLRGNFSRIRWDAVSIRGVRVNFASDTQGVGRLEADALDAAQLSIRDVRAFFRLSPNGQVDIRHLGASLLDQKLTLSGVLQPEAGGGLHWKGFADVNGDFAQVIHRLDASQLFKGGTVHALWSGSGVIREDKPWWNDMQGRLRLRVDDGRILEGGTMTKLLAVLSLADLPGFLTGKRKDITGPGMLYKRLQLESTVEGETAKIRQLAMRASALDMAGKGQINLADGVIDLYVTARPLQNIDALLNMIPLLRDVMLGPAKSLFRKVYHVFGPLHNAKVESVSPEQAGLPNAGLLEQLITLPSRWFDSSRTVGTKEAPALPR